MKITDSYKAYPLTRVKSPLLAFLLFFLLLKYVPETVGQVKASNSGEAIHLADPTIFYHQGLYYLYGTNGANANQGFTVYTSRDLKNWEGPKGFNNGYALRKGDAFGEQGF